MMTFLVQRSLAGLLLRVNIQQIQRSVVMIVHFHVIDRQVSRGKTIQEYNNHCVRKQQRLSFSHYGQSHNRQEVTSLSRRSFVAFPSKSSLSRRSPKTTLLSIENCGRGKEPSSNQPLATNHWRVYCAADIIQTS